MNEMKSAAMEQYMAEHTDDISPLLVELIRETEEKTGKAFWSVGKIEGKFL